MLAKVLLSLTYFLLEDVSLFPTDILFYTKRRLILNGPPFLLFDLDFLLHIDFLSMCIVEHILQESEFLTWNDLDTESVFHLPLPSEGNESLIDEGGDIRMDV